MLKVENITKKYGENVAVNNLSFTVDAGEIFGLLGENGAGKTTTFRIIMGLIDASSGEVLLNGEKIDYNLTDEIGFVTEERSLLTKLTVKELLYGMMLVSGNDAATALALYISPSIEEFANLMTQEAKACGALNTTFKNPHGLDQDGHKTTAYDLALITAYALENETFKEKLDKEESEAENIWKKKKKVQSLIFLYIF